MILRPWKPDKNGLSKPYYYDSKRRIWTDFKIYADAWDQDNQLLKANPVQLNHDQINELIQAFKITNNKPDRKMKFFDMFDYYIESNTNIKAHNYLRSFKTTKYHLEKFDFRLQFNDITLKFYNRFVIYQLDQGLTNNTIDGGAGWKYGYTYTITSNTIE